MNRIRLESCAVDLLALGLLSLVGCSAMNEEFAQPASGGTADETTGSATGTAGDAGASQATWCAARAILEHKCQRCHTTPPDHGAPFALVTYDDTQIQTAAGKPRYELIASALTSDFMPPLWLELDPEVAPLTAAEYGTLLTWCEGGAPAPSPEDSACDALR